MSSSSVTFSPWPGDDHKPTAVLLRYDDGDTIPVLSFGSPEGQVQILLGVLNREQTLAYLKRLGEQVARLQDEVRLHHHPIPTTEPTR
jgi:hypothetical protein